MICFFKDFIYLFLERGEEREKEWERNFGRLPLERTLNWGPNPQPSYVSQPEIKQPGCNLELLALQDNAQPTEPHWSGLEMIYFESQLVRLGSLFT